MKWDNGISLFLVIGADHFKVRRDEPEQQSDKSKGKKKNVVRQVMKNPGHQHTFVLMPWISHVLSIRCNELPRNLNQRSASEFWGYVN